MDSADPSRRAPRRGPLLRSAARLPLVTAALAATLAGCSSPSLDTGRLGRVHLLTPRESPRGVVFLFSGAAGWGSVEDDASARLVARGAAVVGVDLPAYRSALDASDGECLYLLSEIESLSQQVQRRLGVAGYLSPIMAGIGEGGTLVDAALTQTPAATVAGAIAVDPVDALATRLPLCPGAPSQGGPHGFVYGPSPDPLPGFLAIGFTAGADAAGRSHVERRLASGGEGRIEFDAAVIANGAATGPAAVLEQLVEAHLAPRRESSNPDLDASLVEMPADAAGRPLVIVLSGDGGWRDLDKTIAEFLHKRGINVLGWDSLRYFWSAKTPERVAADLDATIRHYRALWKTADVVLVGYSFGADVLPFAYNRLGGDARSSVALLSLLALAPNTDFEIHVTGWLGASSSPDSVDNAAELSRVPAGLIQCFYGEDEDAEDTACPGLAKAGVEVIRTGGDHHFGGDYDALAQDILDGLARRTTKKEAAN